jgi:transcriptional regulator with XRE-family HTH domain
MPKIIEFLGYNPVPYENVTIGGRIKNYRITHGLSHKNLSLLLSVDASTVGSWENKKFKPELESLNRIEQLLQNNDCLNN